MIDTRIASVGAAIGIMEGMHVPAKARATTSCWVHRNPGNIDVHANRTYDSMQAGWQAVFDLLGTYRTVHHYTLEQALEHWAPPFENDTENYIRFVEAFTGIDRKELL